MNTRRFCPTSKFIFSKSKITQKHVCVKTKPTHYLELITRFDNDRTKNTQQMFETENLMIQRGHHM